MALPSSPMAVGGCITWLDGADAATVMLSGPNVTQWRDKSGTGNHFNTTTGAGPTYGAAFGLSALTFPSGVVMTSAKTPVISASTAVFVVAQMTNLSSFNYLFTMPAPKPGGDFSIRFNSGGLIGSATDAGNANDLGMGFYYVNGASVNSTAPAASTYAALTLIDAAALNSSGGTTTFSTSSFTISPLQGDPIISRYFIGNIAEVLVYNGPLSTTDRQGVEGYLAIKWGLQGLLPSAHPFSTANYPACFLAGTRIRVPPPLREAAIETLQVGDVVETADGDSAPIVARHRQQVRVDADPWLLEPCVVRAGVLGATADLFLSPRHGVRIGGDLLPAAHAPGAERSGMRGWVTYYHLQLPRDTDDLVANGVRCESYRHGVPPY